MNQKNKYDKDGSAFKMGTDAENLFEKVLENRNAPFRKSTTRQDIWDHIDYFVTVANTKKEVSVDLKAQKRISRSDKQTVSEELWIEFQNVRGNKGWLYGKADYIVFEQPDGFLFIDREELVDFCKERVDLEDKVDKAYLAKYKSYTRRNRKDILSIINKGDLIEYCKKHFFLTKNI